MTMYYRKIGKQNATLIILKLVLYARPLMTQIWWRNLKMEILIFAAKEKRSSLLLHYFMFLGEPFHYISATWNIYIN